jgi:hypothetical protein
LFELGELVVAEGGEEVAVECLAVAVERGELEPRPRRYSVSERAAKVSFWGLR